MKPSTTMRAPFARSCSPSSTPTWPTLVSRWGSAPPSGQVFWYKRLTCVCAAAGQSRRQVSANPGAAVRRDGGGSPQVGPARLSIPMIDSWSEVTGPFLCVSGARMRWPTTTLLKPTSSRRSSFNILLKDRSIINETLFEKLRSAGDEDCLCAQMSHSAV